MQKKGLRRAVDAMCRQCLGFEALDEDCKGYACPLYVHRHGGCNEASRVIDWAS